MGNYPSTSLSNYNPLENLAYSARVSLLGLDQSGKTSILQHFASYGQTKAKLETTMPSIGVVLESVQRPPLSITSQTVGLSQPKSWTKDIAAMQKSLDALVFVVDYSDPQRAALAVQQIDRFSSSFEKPHQAPLMILRNAWNRSLDAYYQTEYTIQTLLASREIQNRFSQAPTYHRVNAKTGEGLLQALNDLVYSIRYTHEGPLSAGSSTTNIDISGGSP